MTTATRDTRGTRHVSTNPDDAICEVRPRTQKAKLTQLSRLGIETARDLVWHLPRYYEDRSVETRISEAQDGVRGIFRGIASTVNSRRGNRTSVQRTTLSPPDDRESGRLTLIWFGQDHLTRQIEAGDELLVSGTVEMERGRYPTLKQPETDVVRDHNGRRAPVNNKPIAPTYRLTAGMTQAFLRDAIPEVIETCRKRWVRTRPHAERSLYEILRGIHDAEDEEEAETCLEELARDEILEMQLALLNARQDRADKTNQPGLNITTTVADAFRDSLPFRPTGAQERCIEEIRRDIESDGGAMSRLLQGEVGSGKTLVALNAAMDVATAGGQTAFLAPTELLAEQHFGTIRDMLTGSNLGGSANLAFTKLEGREKPFCVALLTGSTRATERRLILGQAQMGIVDVLIGTNAIIQEGVTLPNQQLAIADEQHRFGVEQRAHLRGNTHYLMLTATPIPRTMQLTMYRDLDVSTIDEMPENREPVETTVLGHGDRETAYRRIREEAKAGRQSFIVYPLVESSPDLEAQAATTEYPRLRDKVFPDLAVGMIHGRMKQREREQELRRFKEGELDVMVATAVIEVGIDIPNATVMMIESAERFGIAQLHQFRGRVGRGEHAGACYIAITPGHAPSPETRRRLIAVRDSTDGMRLAEMDLQIRGHGDLAGERQSGESRITKASRFYTLPMLEQEREMAERIHAEDPRLARPEHRALRDAVDRMRAQIESGSIDH